MDRNVGDDQPVDDEVSFWRGFIAWWIKNRADPVPRRAWKALDLAERKADGTRPNAFSHDHRLTE